MLRAGMDRSVAEEAERKLVVLALDPARAVADQPIAAQARALATTVWPALLEPAIEADTQLDSHDTKTVELEPRSGEDADAYLQRVCGGALASTCKHAVPELQAPLVRALAIRRATERVRTAVEDCLTCSTDPGWHAAVDGWETLDRAASAKVVDQERAADHENWPIAGAASDSDPGLPEAELDAHGDLVVDGHSYGPNQLRIDVLRELRGTGDVIALHFLPDTSLAAVRAILDDARRAGCAKVAVVAREPEYPWRRRIYWVADGSGMRANLRTSDTLQLLLHAVDEVAGPGTVARVD